MREILFRGKRKADDKWIYGDLVHFVHFDGSETTDINLRGALNECYSVKPDSVGQFTGLSDCNGTRIFEGDILDFCLDILPDLVSTRFVGVVDFEDGGFYVRCNGNSFGLMEVFNSDDTLDVVGNIFDNPEKAEGLL